MNINHKWYWIVGSIALIGASFLLRRKAAELWHRAREHRDTMPTGS